MKAIDEVAQDYEFIGYPDLKSLNLYELLEFSKDGYNSKAKTFSIYILHLISKSISELFEKIEDDIAKFEDLFEKEKLLVNDEDKEIPLKIGRNDPCYCGSGKTYKKCCMK